MSLVDLSNYHILLVDDVSFSRNTIARQLRTMGNPTILEANDGAEALEHLKLDSVVDIVISDFNMPVMNGLQLLQAIRSGAAGVRRDLSFAILTGFSDRHLVDLALSLGVNAFLVKPVSRSVVSDRLQQMIKAADGRMPPRSAQEYSKIPLPDGKISASGFDNSFERMLKNDAEVFNFLPSELSSAQLDLTPTVTESAPAAETEATTDSSGPMTTEMQVKSVANVVRLLTCLEGRYSSDLARTIVKKIKRLILAAGEELSLEVVADLNSLVLQKALRVEDLPTILSQNMAGTDTASQSGWNIAKPTSGDGRKHQRQLDEEQYETVQFHDLTRAPENSVLGRSLYTANGGVFLVSGTKLTHSLLSILLHLENTGVLDLASDDGGRGVYIAAATDRKASSGSTDAPSAAAPNRLATERKITIDEADVGMVVLRDVYTNTGINYMNEGTVLTEGLLTVLHDLQKLGSVENELWIQVSAD